MGEVFLAQRRAGGVAKRLVIKRISRARASDPRFLAMFLREAQLSMALTHQNIVAVFDFGRTQGDVFLAMEHVEGVDLATARARAVDPRVPPLIAAFIGAECCRALDHAHRRNGPDGAPLRVVHRDVSPRNLLLSRAGEVKLADFGVAALAGEQPGRAQGTAAFMAPEQARGETVDGRADLYALGLVLWEMLAGARVRPSGDAEAQLATAVSGTLPPIDDAIPPPLRAILARATAAAPGERYADARAMLGELDSYIVATRAAHASAAPAELLAAWLDAAMPGGELGGEELDGPPIDGVVTFGVEGPGAVGGGTLVSRAVTIDDDAGATAPPPDPPLAPPVPPEPSPSGGSRALRSGVAAPPRSAWSRAGRVTAGVTLVIGAWLASRAMSGSSTPTPSPSTSLTPPSATVSGSAPAAVSPRPEATAMPSPATPSPPPPAAPVREIGARGSADRSHAAQPAVHHAAPALPIDPPSAMPPTLHAVVIGAKPWATFRVDDQTDAHQTPEALQLVAGSHRIHFQNATLGIEREVTILVPTTGDLRYVEDLTR